MPGVTTRAREAIALVEVPIACVNIEDEDRARIVSRLCNFSTRFSKGIDTLTITLTPKEFVNVAHDINNILRRSVDLAVLTLNVERISRASLLRAFHRVNLPNLLILVVPPTSHAILFSFIQRHNSSLRNIDFSGQGSGGSVPPNIVASLHLDTLVGPCDFIAEFLSRCLVHVPEVRLTGEITPTTLKKLQRVRGRLYHVYKLTIELHPLSLETLCGVSSHFPRLRSLKIIELGTSGLHIWLEAYRWRGAISSLPRLKRLVIQIPEMTGRFSTPVNGWFNKPIVVEDVEVETPSRLVGQWNRDRRSSQFARMFSA
ncbi:hypothetical protein EV122DRAFT_285341 [Schizophyllum commune]